MLKEKDQGQYKSECIAASAENDRTTIKKTEQWT
jgi:hypothetical protein